MFSKISKKEDIYYIEAPFQLMSALSKIKSEWERSVIVFRGSGNIKNDRQTEMLLGTYTKNSDVIRLGEGIVKPLLKTIILGFCCRVVGGLKILNTGDYRSKIGNIMIKVLPIKKVVLIDDGVAILNICKTDDNGLLKIEKNQIPINYNRKLEISTFLRINAGDDILMYNNPIGEWMKRRQKKVGVINNELVYVIGSKVVEEEIMSIQAYFNILRKVKRRISKYSIVYYIPHRGESESKLKLIEDRFEINIKNIALPIELFLAESKELPSLIIGMISAALITISECFDEIHVCAVKTSLPDIKDKYIQGVANTEKYILESSEIEVI